MRHIIALGGTFDHFHLGHEHFIEFASQLGDKLHIGVTSQKMTLSKAYPNAIQDFATRKNNITRYCQQQKINCEISQLNDPYGPTLESNDVKALCVTQETMWSAQKINELRLTIGKRSLDVHVCPWIKDENGEILSSTRIRAGAVNRQGTVYANLLNQDFKLNEAQRTFFSKLQGKLISDKFSIVHSPLFIAIVGDIALEKFLQNSWRYNLAIYDKKTGRESYNSRLIANIKPDLTCDNQAGSISLALTKALQTCLQQNLKHLFVAGEEDLATVALVLLLPLDSVIYYGQPDKGLVELFVSEKVKEKFYAALS